MKVLIVFLVLKAILILISILFSFGLYIYIAKPKLFSHEQALQIEQSKDFVGDFYSLKSERLNITCRDGYVLNGLFIPNEGAAGSCATGDFCGTAKPSKSTKLAIITHGYTYNWEGSIKYANIFHSLGYSVYIYDDRHHGYNKRTYCTMSLKEGLDVADVYGFFREKYGKDAVIGLHGESMGAASSIRALEFCPDADFLIEDCGFADLGLLLEYKTRHDAHLAGFVSHGASFASLLLHGFRLDRIRPIESLAKNTATPVLFIHGKSDTFIPVEHAQKLYEACNSPKKLCLFDNADHAQSFQTDRERYKKEVADFIAEYVKNGN